MHLFVFRRSVVGLFLFALAVVGVACGGSAGPDSLETGGSALVFAQDAPLDNLVKFEITVTGVVFNPGGVSVLPEPKEIELTSLEMTSSLFRVARNIPPATYTSVTLTFANPEIKFLDAGGNVVEIKPPLQNSSVTENVTFSVVEGQSVGLLIDFDLEASVVTDAGGTITGVNPVLTVSVIDLAGLPAEFEEEGQVVSVDRTSSTSGTFVFESFSSCQQFTIRVNSSTEFDDFGEANPPLANSFDSVRGGQIVEVEADVQADGTFLAEEVELESEVPEDDLEGLIVAVTRDPTTEQVSEFQMLLFDVAPCTATVPAEDLITVTVPTDPAPAFKIDDDGFPVNATHFDDPGDLEVGQKVEVDPVEALTTATTAVTAEKIELEDQTIRGSVISTAGTSFELDPVSDLFPDQSITVETSVNTDFDDLPNGVAGLSPGQEVRVKGLLFRIAAGEQRMVAKGVDGTP